MTRHDRDDAGRDQANEGGDQGEEGRDRQDRIPVDLRKAAEEVVEARTGTSRPPRTRADEQALIHELEVHQIELEMQNEELRQARREAEILQEKYIDLYDFAPVGYFTLDPDGTICEVNLAGCQLLGSPREKVTGRRFHVFLTPASTPAFHAFCRNILAVDGKQVCEAEFLRDGEHRFYAQLEGSLVPTGNGEHRKLRMTVSDITQRKMAEQALQESETKFRQLFEHMGSGVAVFRAVDGGDDFVFTDFNRAGEHIDRVSREDLIGRRVTEAFPGVKEMPFFPALQRVWRTGVSDYLPESLYQDERNPGTWRENRVYRLPSGEVVAVYNDITERKRTEEALALSSRKLTLLSSITRHDIQNQLMALKGYLDLCRDSIDDRTVLLSYLEKGERAALVIEKQVQFTKEYQDLGSRAPGWQDVNTCARIVVSQVPHQRDIPVKVDQDGLEVFADPLFEKVFYNLLDNSYRYGGEGMTTIRVTSREVGDGCVIVYEDDGGGISAEDKKKLFSRGFGKNTGLGLFLSREILSITGITITENGIPGKDARFEMLVPKGGYRYGTGK